MTPMHYGALHCLVLYYEAMPDLICVLGSRGVVSNRGEEYAMRGKESCKKAVRFLEDFWKIFGRIPVP
jgi:hypothetical protein